MFAFHRKKRKAFAKRAKTTSEIERRSHRWHDEIRARSAWDYDSDSTDTHERYQRQNRREYGSRSYNNDREHHRSDDEPFYRQHHLRQYDNRDPAPARRFSFSILSDFADEFEYLHERIDEIEDKLAAVVRRQKRLYR